MGARGGAVPVLVVVVGTVAVGVHAVVPGIGGAGVDGGVGVVAVGAAVGAGVEAIPVLVVVRALVAVLIHAVVPGLFGGTAGAVRVVEPVGGERARRGGFDVQVVEELGLLDGVVRVVQEIGGLEAVGREVVHLVGQTLGGLRHRHQELHVTDAQRAGAGVGAARPIVLLGPDVVADGRAAGEDRAHREGVLGAGGADGAVGRAQLQQVGDGGVEVHHAAGVVHLGAGVDGVGARGREHAAVVHGVVEGGAVDDQEGDAHPGLVGGALAAPGGGVVEAPLVHLALGTVVPQEHDERVVQVWGPGDQLGELGVEAFDAEVELVGLRAGAGVPAGGGGVCPGAEDAVAEVVADDGEVPLPGRGPRGHPRGSVEGGLVGHADRGVRRGGGLVPGAARGLRDRLHVEPVGVRPDGPVRVPREVGEPRLDGVVREVDGARQRRVRGGRGLAEVPLAEHAGLQPGVLRELLERVGRLAHPRGAGFEDRLADTVPVGGLAGHHQRARRGARRGRPGVGEPDAGRAHDVEVGRGRAGLGRVGHVPRVGAHLVHADVVGDDDQDVAIVGGEGGEGQRQREEGDARVDSGHVVSWRAGWSRQRIVAGGRWSVKRWSAMLTFGYSAFTSVHIASITGVLSPMSMLASQ